MALPSPLLTPDLLVADYRLALLAQKQGTWGAKVIAICNLNAEFQCSLLSLIPQKFPSFPAFSSSTRIQVSSPPLSLGYLSPNATSESRICFCTTESSKCAALRVVMKSGHYWSTGCWTVAAARSTVDLLLSILRKQVLVQSHCDRPTPLL